MRSSKAIILLGMLIQALIFLGQRYFGELFSSQLILAPLRGLEVVVTFVVGALVDFAIGFWFVKSQQHSISLRKSRAVMLGSLTAATARFIGTLLSILIYLFFILNSPSLQETMQGPGRAVALLNIALVSLNPICSGILIGIVFGGLGGYMANSLHGETRGDSSPA